MNDRIRKHLYDLLQAINEIEQFVEGFTEPDYLEDLKTQRAVERNFEVIGEALNRVKREDPRLIMQISEHHKIIGFRNVLAHG